MTTVDDGKLAGDTMVRTVHVTPGAADLDPDRYARRLRLQKRVLGIATPVLLIAIWETLGRVGMLDRSYFPPPSAILSASDGMVRDGSLLRNTMVTIQAWVVAFCGGFVVGTSVGALMGLSRVLRAALEPTLSALYTIPKLAILPLLLLIFGLGETPKIILVGLGVFFITWITTVEAILNIPEGYLETARSFNVSRGRTVRKVIFPAILPDIFVGARIAVGQSILILIGVEFVTGGDGLGHMIWNSWQIFAADRMYVGIIVVAILGFVLTNIVQVLGRVLVPWAPRTQRTRS